MLNRDYEGSEVLDLMILNIFLVSEILAAVESFI